MAEDSRAFAFTDIDGDGNLDIVLKSRLAPQIRIFQNACGAGRKTIVLALRGTESNRDAIGARVEIDGQVKWLAAGSAYLSQHTKRLHFGLGRPRARGEGAHQTGLRARCRNCPRWPPAFFMKLTEGSPELRAKPLAPRKEWPADVAFPIDNGARVETTWFREPVPLPEKRRGPALLVLHAGEPLPRYSVPVETVDLRRHPRRSGRGLCHFPPVSVRLSRGSGNAAVAADRFRGQRAEDLCGSADAAAVAEADLHIARRPIAGCTRAAIRWCLPRPAHTRLLQTRRRLLQAGYGEQALPYLEEMHCGAVAGQSQGVAGAIGRIHLEAKRCRRRGRRWSAPRPWIARLPEAWNESGRRGIGRRQFHRQPCVCYERALAIGPGSCPMRW